MNFCCISDLHGHLDFTIPECDVLLISGDICPVYDHNVYFQANWLHTAFNAWIKNQPAKHKIICAGNHDWVFALKPELIKEHPDWTYLQDTNVKIGEHIIHGTPWQPYFYDWAFNAPENNGEEFLAEKFKLIPEETTILIFHGPPWGILDGKLGSTSLLKRVKELKNLQLHVFGHIHFAHGLKKIGNTTFINAALVNEKYQRVNEPYLEKVKLPKEV